MVCVELSQKTLDFIKSNIGNSQDLVLWSSFCGAFFAFLFVGIAGLVKRIYDRNLKNFNSIVSLEHVSNENFQILYDNILMALNMVNEINGAISKKAININFDTFDDLIVRPDLIIDLLDIDFINKYFDHNIELKKINSDF
jgi:hypothetical protein